MRVLSDSQHIVNLFVLEGVVGETMAATAPAKEGQAEPVVPYKVETTPEEEARAPMAAKPRTFSSNGIGATDRHYRGFWRSDALPIGIAVVMLLVVFLFAAFSH
jgi:hypothetical protein